MIQPALRVRKAPTIIILIIFKSGSEPGWAASATPQVEGSTRSHVPIGLSNLINRKYAFVVVSLSFSLVEKHLWESLLTLCNENGLGNPPSPEDVGWTSPRALLSGELQPLRSYKWKGLYITRVVLYSRYIEPRYVGCLTRGLTYKTVTQPPTQNHTRLGARVVYNTVIITFEYGMKVHNGGATRRPDCTTANKLWTRTNL